MQGAVKNFSYQAIITFRLLNENSSPSLSLSLLLTLTYSSYTVTFSRLCSRIKITQLDHTIS